ncbi:MerR family transcriptional regulator [Lactococcus nasutitermitis]|uniref:MerR family transcriptional regulator n=1 Tax=Lactococcus nasutitermitis TaxID=1652957 RepID=A0ABV9JB73_9LACT|nr:MerR family transcriptional regulator [Lactococcus nasutitermitis]
MTSITEMAKYSGLSADTLRFYEKEGLIQVPRNARGVRDYDESARRQVYSVRCYRRAGLPLATIRELLVAPEKHTEHIDLLKTHREQVVADLASLSETLDYLDYRIAQSEENLPGELARMEDWVKHSAT